MARERGFTGSDAAMMAHQTMEATSLQLGGVRLVLPFIFVALSGPVIFAAMIYPLFKAADLLTGILLAPVVASTGAKRLYLCLGMAVKCLGLLIVVIVAAGLGPALLTLVTFIVAVVLGIGAGIQRLAEKSVMAVLWDSRQRASRLGATEALTGFLAIGAVILTAVYLQDSDQLSVHIELLWGGATAAILSAIFALFIRESLGRDDRPAVVNNRGAWWTGIKASYRRLSRQRWFRRFVATRLLTSSVEYGVVFYAIHAASFHASKPWALSAFAAATASGAVVGGLLARQIVRRAAASGLWFGGLLGFIAASTALAVEQAPHWNLLPVYSAIFLLLGIGRSCIYTSRNAYLLLFIDAEDRENGVALSNLVVEGIAAAAMIAIGALAHYQDIALPLVLLGLLSLGAVFSALMLPPEAEARPPVGGAA